MVELGNSPVPAEPQNLKTPIKTKLFKLVLHQKNFSVADLVINSKDFPSIKVGDIIEIYHPEDEFSRLLLQYAALPPDLHLQQKDTISVEHSVASPFQLRNFKEVYVNIIDPDNVALDSVELTFKDQYLGRGEMWRLKNNLMNTCVYINKKIEFCGGSVRCQVHEMWAGGERVACGVINESTKVVFRSSTSLVYLFIQLSSEMWDFDIHGDLYFEKAVNGFLNDLFAKWKKYGSNPEVTIVLFSRTFYKAHSVDDFPEFMRECLQRDYRGRFYEDFYRIAVQNERYDDWTNTLTELRRLSVDYRKTVLEYHQCPGAVIPKAFNSTASQGNFLEVLNMSLNVFEKHYMDRSFDRTGQLSVVITPGVGVFEVDRELTNITKQRIIDNGVGSDLVCVGEQPLHAVPLLKFHNKDSNTLNVGDDYSMPHWINLSFYSTNKKVGYSTFVPRIKLPSRKESPTKAKLGVSMSNGSSPKIVCEDSALPNSIYDYDAYDELVFQLPTPHCSRYTMSLQRRSRKKSSNIADRHKVMNRKLSDPDIRHSLTITETIAANKNSAAECHNTLSSSVKSKSIAIPNNSVKDIPQYSSSFGALINEGKKPSQSSSHEWEKETCAASQPSCPGIEQSPAYEHNPLQRYLLRPGRALINPFDPSHVTIKLTSNRRRWTHIFPKGPTGVLIQQHHYQAVPTKASDEQPLETSSVFGSPMPYEDMLSTSGKGRHASSSSRKGVKISDSAPHTIPPSGLSQTLIWGATGEQEWTPAISTGSESSQDFIIPELRHYCEATVGVDWKSLTIPACLPITTDYFPDERSFQNDYVVSNYSLLPDDVNADYAQQRAVYRRPLTTAEVCQELVSQRLAQGFQLVVQPSPSVSQTSESSTVTNIPWENKQLVNVEPIKEYFLSIGRLFHKIALSGSTVTVTRYRPRHPYPVKNIHYRYRFQAPDNDTYEVSWVEFTTEKLENYNWNYLDHYICTKGDPDFVLQESAKFWRFRMYLLPIYQPETKKITDGSQYCDLYSTLPYDERCNLVDGFLRFMETCVNRIRKIIVGKKNRSRREPTASISSAFRERLGSSRISEALRPRAGTGSKVTDRIKSESTTGSGRASPVQLDFTNLLTNCTVGMDKASNSTSPIAPSSSEGSINTVDGCNENNIIQPEECVEVKPLKSTSSFMEILDALRHPQTGISFITQHPNLPNWTFCSADASLWLIEHMDGITTEGQANVIYEDMLKERLIMHASGRPDHPFLYGFYLYYIATADKDHAKDAVRPSHGDCNFQNEWIEVEIEWYRDPNSSHTSPTESPGSPKVTSPTKTPPPNFLLEDLLLLNDSAESPRKTNAKSLYKEAYLEVDVGNKSEREEWGHIRYQSYYHPKEAFEIVMQWMSATGAVISDLIHGWARKSQPCGFQLVPIPCDPFALPYSYKSDPLRGPIFVPVNIECLMEQKNHLFEEFSEDSHERRLFLFHEFIAQKFGFIHCSTEHCHHRPNPLSVQHQYVHATGNMFLLIPTKIPPDTNNLAVPGSHSCREDLVVQSPHEEYITRHVTGKNKDSYDEDSRIGFLWSWNYMVSKRWRYSPYSVLADENFQNKMLRDFRAFCANEDNRLKLFWDTCWKQIP